MLYDEGRHDQALAAYREIKARAPALSLVNMQIGNSHLAKKSYAEAEAAYQEVLKNDAADANGLYAMGALREAQGNAADAKNWYEKASAADLGLDSAAHEIGSARSRRRRPPRRIAPPDPRHRDRCGLARRPERHGPFEEPVTKDLEIP